MAVAGGGAGGAGEAKVPRTEGAEEQKEGSQETIEVSPGGDETSARSPAGDKPADGDAVEGAGREGAGKDGCLPVDKAATSLAPDEAENATHKLGSQRQPQQPASIAAKERPDDGPAQEPWGDAMDVAEEPTLVGRVDSSDEEDEDDGFKVVVGREVAPAVTTAAPTKRFLRGEGSMLPANVRRVLCHALCCLLPLVGTVVYLSASQPTFGVGATPCETCSFGGGVEANDRKGDVLRVRRERPANPAPPRSPAQMPQFQVRRRLTKRETTGLPEGGVRSENIHPRRERYLERLSMLTRWWC